MGNGLAEASRSTTAGDGGVAVARCARVRTPLLKSVLRFELIRRGLRVLTLASMDLWAMFFAIFTALAIKTQVVSPDTAVLHNSYNQAKDYAPLACLVMLLLFARSGLYRDRRAAPGLRDADLVAVPGHGGHRPVRGDRGLRVLVLLHLLRVAVLRPDLRVGASAGSSSASAGGCCMPRATAAGPCSWARGRTSTRSPTRCATAREVEPFGYVSLSTPRPARACATSARSRPRAQLRRDRRGADRRPRLPAGPGGRAGRPLSPPRRARAGGAVDDGDPDGPGRVRPGAVAAAVRAQAAGVRRRGLRGQARVRPRRVGAAAPAALARAARSSPSRSSSTRAARALPLDAAGHGRQSRSPA